MTKYLLVFYGGANASTPAAENKSMDAWMGWFGKLGKAVVDMGAPTAPGKIIRASGMRAVGKDPVTGYTIIQAADMKAAVELAKGTPNIPAGGSVAVYEILPM